MLPRLDKYDADPARPLTTVAEELIDYISVDHDLSADRLFARGVLEVCKFACKRPHGTIGARSGPTITGDHSK